MFANVYRLRIIIMIVLYNHYRLLQLFTLYIAIFVSGRVHSAVVSGVNLEQRTVTVEWFERGETKGKEVSATNYSVS